MIIKITYNTVIGLLNPSHNYYSNLARLIKTYNLKVISNSQNEDTYILEGELDYDGKLAFMDLLEINEDINEINIEA